jgi:hypothetical protein
MLQLTALQEAEKQTGVQQSPQDWGTGRSLSLGISFYCGELKEGGSGTGHTIWHFSAGEFFLFGGRNTRTLRTFASQTSIILTNIKSISNSPTKLSF